LVKPVRFSTVPRDDDVVLDAPNARQVDPQLDGDDVAGREDVVGPGTSRQLVHVETEAVAEPVAEWPGQAVLDGAPRRLICSIAGMSAQIASRPASWAKHDEAPPSPRRRAARSRTCVCSRTHSRRRCSRVDHHELPA
jgi:hypothetical protein